MEEVWERAMESALDGQTDSSSTRSLNLDGAIKYLHGRLLPPALLGKFGSLEQLSLANNGISSLENFPRLKNLQKLVLSDNRITNGLEFLVGLDSLRDLDLSNNRIQFVEDLAPLEKLKLVSLDLYECPVTKVDNYRARVFAMIKTLRYLDNMDMQNNERPESDEEDENEDDEEEDDDFEEDNDDLGSGEVDADNLNDGALDVEDGKNDNGNTATDGKICSVGKEKKRPTASSNRNWKEDDAHGSDEEEEDVEDEEVDGDEEALSTGDVLEEEEDEEDGDTLSVDHLTSTEGELDEQDQSEEEDDDNEEVEDVDRENEDQDADEEDDAVGDYLVQPVVLPKKGQETGVDDVDDDGVDEDDVEEGCVQPSLHSKRKRSESDFDGAVKKDRTWAKRR